jgi:cyclopropane fatty-acyl-phospholipid synthase-like methyltransferase
MTFADNVRRQFGRPEGQLGKIAGLIMAHRRSNHERNRWTVELLHIAPDDHVLEIGYGPGIAIAFAAAAITTGKVIGIDHSELMHARASRFNAASIQSGKVELYKGELDLLPTLPGPFDKVLMVNVFQFLSDPEEKGGPSCACEDFAGHSSMPDRLQTLAAIKGVMKPNGTLAITHMPRQKGAQPADAHRFAQQVIKQMAASGFRDLKIEMFDCKRIPASCVLGCA